MNLSLKYRPITFEDVCGQQSIIKILNKQIETNTFRNCYLFAGPSGCGKTTIARIMANKINKGIGSPIEIDGASNNGVDNVRVIIDSANERSFDGEYKIYIIDECHQITTAGWNAFLKCIEEPPKYTIFIFCTTDPQKVPLTIKNRCQVFNLARISDSKIKERLNMICSSEGYFANESGIDSIVRLCDGSMRQAITYLDKVKDYSLNITEENVSECLGVCNYDIFFDLTNARIDGDRQKIISIIDSVYNKGIDLRIFVNDYINFILDLCKYCLFNSLEITKLSKTFEDKIKYTTNIDNKSQFFNNYLENLLNIKQRIKGDSNIKSTIEIMLIGG